MINTLKNIGCFKEGEFTLKSGKESKYYIDLRHLVSHPFILKQLSNEINSKIGNYNGLICGLPYAGIPYAQTVSILHTRPSILLRKEQKKHGTGRMIEGEYKSGDELVIIDDVLTSGKSIIESLEHLKDFRIRKIVVIVDREEGGKEMLQNMGYIVESLYKVSDFTTTTLRERIYKTIIKKQSNICLSLDYTRTEQILGALDILKDKIVMIKTHCDIIENFTSKFVEEMVQICEENDIFIFEDRKFADIGNTFKHQFTGGMYKIKDWCDITNFHSLVGEGIINQFRECKEPEQGGLLIAEMSNEGNILDANYTLRTMEMANRNRDSIIGFISQRKICDGFLHITPGVRIGERDDGKDQRYITPKDAMSKGVDVLIVGRGIIESNNIFEECEKYRLEGWDNYKNK